MENEELAKGLVNPLNGKLVMLSEKLRIAFLGSEDFLPVELFEKHPHIVNKVNQLWPGIDLINYLNELMVTDRGNRDGFSSLSMKELIFLKDLHNLYQPTQSKNHYEEIEIALKKGYSPTTIDDLKNPEANAISMKKLDDSVFSTLKEHNELRHWGEISSIPELRVFCRDKVERDSKLRKRIGEILMDFGVIKNDHIESALQEQKILEKKIPLGVILVQRKHCNEEDIKKALIIQDGIGIVNLDMIKITEYSLLIIKQDIARKFEVVPIAKINNILFLAVENPMLFKNNNLLQNFTGFKIEYLLARRNAILRRLNTYKSGVFKG
jgi:hypothetical protein